MSRWVDFLMVTIRFHFIILLQFVNVFSSGRPLCANCRNNGRDGYCHIEKLRSHSVFAVYAHDNTNIGEANAELVKKLIQWLKDAGVNLLSDRLPWDDNRPSHVKTRGTNDKNPGRDILWNQMRYFPQVPLF